MTKFRTNSKGEKYPITPKKGNTAYKIPSNKKQKIKKCSYCNWGFIKTKKGIEVYDSDGKLHHIEKKGATNYDVLNKGYCPIHGIKLS